MKTLQFLRKKIKEPSVIGFLCASALYLGIFSLFFEFFERKVIVQENGTESITIKVASFNNGGDQTRFSQSPPKSKTPRKKKPKKQPTKTLIPQDSQEKPPAPPKQEKTHQNPQNSNITQEGAQAQSLAYNQGISDEFLSKIRLAIANHNPYPRIARMRGLEGEVMVEFVLNIDGSLEGLKILQSNASEILNKTALKAVSEAHKNFPTPKQKVRIKVPIIYNLARK